MSYSISLNFNYLSTNIIKTNNSSIGNNWILNPLGILCMSLNFWRWKSCWVDYICRFLCFWGFFLPWKLTFSEHWMDFTLVFVCLMTYVSYIFLLDTTIFAITEDEKEEKNSVLQVLEFWGILLKFKEKILKIYKHSWLSITWALKKLNSTQTLSDNIPEIKFSHWSLLSKTYRNLYLIMQTPIALNNFCVLS